jgi:hypothetical protein
VEKDLIRQFFLEANPKEDRRDCPDEATLKEIAEHPHRVNHEVLLHLESCSECFAEFRGFKVEAEDRQRRRLVLGAIGIAACLLVGIVLWKAPFLGQPGIGHPSVIEEAEVTREIDLSRYEATRGVGDNAARRFITYPAIAQSAWALQSGCVDPRRRQDYCH